MKFNKKVSLGASLLLMLTPIAITSAQEWNARTVEEINAELILDEENKMTYVVKYGDTLGAIAEAMNIDLAFLAEVNQIENINLIYPGTKLVAEYDANQAVEKLNIEASSGEIYEMDVPVSLTPQTETKVQNNQTDQVVTSKEPILNVNEAEDFEVVEEVSEMTTAPSESNKEAVIETSAVLLNEIPEVTEAVVEDVLTEAPTFEEALAPQAEVSTTEIEEAAQPDAAELTVTKKEQIKPEMPSIETTQISSSEIETISAEEVEQPVISEELVEAPVTSLATTEEAVETYEETPVTEEVIPNYTTPSTLAGVSASAAKYGSRIVNAYGVTAYGLRPGDSGDHGKGLAVDFMVPVGSTIGDQIASDAVANMGNSNISYVIWKQQIYGDWTGGQWQSMEDRGSVTQNHYDHVHVSFNR
ncbi:LysM peptidoglycan-binding domain-containing protein [Facklamia miroungae]|uniref:LysM domain-containing protein n=1 Tax=Facklamia miroungae TaxID=120956 RepID=A0A1G7S121_9LACT|nr:LysM domain-containing protein [Facklamia miroungae]NKZ29205.1 LysM peptidoglycan-binding domain-containing protein [Facklamia miroungae]SDG16691.1 LysM domain-containing protein [Facklamia miroungae]